MEKVYKGIEFAKGYNKPFADFKKEFGSTHVFKEIPSADREAELEKVYEYVTGNPAVPKPSSGKQNEVAKPDKPESK